jgi:phosphoribosylanthranilate isomerase
MRLKVCGMTQYEQVLKLEELQVAFGGFIYYPKSPRYALRHLTTSQIKAFKHINKVGVFVNPTAEEVLYMIDECRLHMVQLHGDETPKFCERIADYISVVKAFRIGAGENLEYKIAPYMEVCDMFLFDTAPAAKGTETHYGGTGQKFNWSLLRNVEVGKPYFLSGGIGPDDVADVKAFAEGPAGKALFALDVNSRFETSPGIKDMPLIEKFIKELQ